MLYPDVPSVRIDQFNGSILKLDPYAVPKDKCLYSQNTGYVRGLAGTRLGHSAVVTASDGAITSMVNWYFVFSSTQVSVALYYAPSLGIKGWQQGGAGFTGTLIAQTGAAGSTMVTSGQRLYASFYDATGRLGFAPGQIYGWNIGADPLFAAPITNTPTVSETGAGVCTAGTRRIGYLMTTRNGYTGVVCPVTSGGAQAPVSFTSTGSKNLRVSIPGGFPSYMTGGSIQVVMTTTSNLNRYFTVPGAVANVLTNPTNITLSISDDDLAATGTDVTANTSATLLTSTVGGTAPFVPNSIFVYSSRMGYTTIDSFGFPVTYISDPNNFQFLSSDQHGIYIEGLAQAVAGFSLRGVCYLATPHAFYSTEDNGGVPVSWTPPQKVDGSIGVLSPTCITVNPAQGYAGIASDRGFYLFQGGVFPALPLSYYQDSDWRRINWSAPTTVQVADDQLNKRFVVAVPLRDTVAAVSGSGPYTVTTATANHLYQTGLSVTITGVTGAQTITVTGVNTFTIPGGSGAPTVGGTITPQTASHQMTWDYTEGDTPETVKYSLNSFTSYRMGALAIIQNLTNFLNEVWYAPAANGPLIRQNDGTEATPYRDVDLSSSAAAIAHLYQTALVPGVEDRGQTIHDFHGMHARVFGNGNWTLKVFGLDGVRTTTPARSPVTLSLTPGKEELIKWFLRSEQESIQWGTNAVDHFCAVSLLTPYYTNAMAQR